MAGSIDKVLQSDGTYKWEVVEPKTEAQKAAEVSPAPTPQPKTESKKKTSKKKSTNILSE